MPIQDTRATADGVYFDLDADGTKEKTAWVKASDGFMVKDRDGNGVIDSGKELYGDDTVNAGGGNDTASNASRLRKAS